MVNMLRFVEGTVAPVQGMLVPVERGRWKRGSNWEMLVVRGATVESR